MAIINIKESLLAMDKKTNCRYDLTSLYEACDLKEEDKEKLVRYIDTKEPPFMIGQFLSSKCPGVCESVEDDVTEADMKKIIDEVNEGDDHTLWALLDKADKEDAKLTEDVDAPDYAESAANVRKHVWDKISEYDRLTDDDSRYWDFDRAVHEGDNAILTTQENLPSDARYLYSFLPEVDIDMYAGRTPDGDVWYVVDNTVMDEGILKDIGHVAKAVGKEIADTKAVQAVTGAAKKVGSAIKNSDAVQSVVNSKFVKNVGNAVKETDTYKGVKNKVNYVKANNAIKNAKTKKDLRAAIKEYERMKKSGKLDDRILSAEILLTIKDKKKELGIKEALTEDYDVIKMNDKYFPVVDINDTSRYDYVEYKGKQLAYDKKDHVLHYLFKDEEEIELLGGEDQAPFRSIDAVGLSLDSWNDKEERDSYLQGYSDDMDDEASYLMQDFIENELPYYKEQGLVDSLATDKVEESVNPDHYEILDWLNDHEQAYADAEKFFGDKGLELTDVDQEELVSWIQDHDQLYSDFKNHFKEYELEEATATAERPLSALGGTLSSVLLAHKDEVDTLFTAKDAVEFLDRIRPEVKNVGYVDKVKADIMRKRGIIPVQYFYNIILKGDGEGAVKDNTKKSLIKKWAAQPAMESVETDEEKPYTHKQIFDELKLETKNFTVEEDSCRYGFKEEAEMAVKILEKHYASVELDTVGSWFQIDFKDRLKKSIKEASYKKGDRVELDNGMTGTVTKDFDWENEDQVSVEIDGTGEMRYPRSETLQTLRESFPSNINLDQVVIKVANLVDDRELGDNWIEVFPTRDARPIAGGEYYIPLEITGPEDLTKKATFKTRNGRVEVAFLNGSEAMCDSAEEIARFIAGEFGLTLGEETPLKDMIDKLDAEEEVLDAEVHDYSEDELRKLGAFDNLDIDESVSLKEEIATHLYLFPELTDEDMEMAKAYGLQYLGKNHGADGSEDNWVMAGDADSIRRFADKWLGYALHPDYFYNIDDFAGDIVEDDEHNRNLYEADEEVVDEQEEATVSDDGEDTVSDEEEAPVSGGDAARAEQVIDKLTDASYEQFVKILNSDGKSQAFLNFLKQHYKLGDDAIQTVKKSSAALAKARCSKLTPTQRNISLSKSLGMIKDKAKWTQKIVETPMEAFDTPTVTYAGRYIIDGHHRWSKAYAMNGGDSMIKVLNFPEIEGVTWEDMLKAVQLAIVATTPSAKLINEVGNDNMLTTDKNTIYQFVLKNMCDEVAQMLKENGRGDSKKEAAKNITFNVLGMQKNKLSKPVKGAPQRQYMPQMDDDGKAERKLKQAVIDLESEAEADAV